MGGRLESTHVFGGMDLNGLAYLLLAFAWQGVWGVGNGLINENPDSSVRRRTLEESHQAGIYRFNITVLRRDRSYPLLLVLFYRVRSSVTKLFMMPRMMLLLQADENQEGLSTEHE
jgi:hypothetical protein